MNVTGTQSLSPDPASHVQYKDDALRGTRVFSTFSRECSLCLSEPTKNRDYRIPYYGARPGNGIQYSEDISQLKLFALLVGGAVPGEEIAVAGLWHLLVHCLHRVR
jgi:hypothetical protein